MVEMENRNSDRQSDMVYENLGVKVSALPDYVHRLRNCPNTLQQEFDVSTNWLCL